MSFFKKLRKLFCLLTNIPQYYYLKPGDALQIGDEYERGSSWVVWDECDYRQWVTAVSHYWPDQDSGMSRFRRPKNKPRELLDLTIAIYERATYRVFIE